MKQNDDTIIIELWLLCVVCLFGEVYSNPDVAVTHKVLQRFRVHAGLCHIAAIGVTADVWGYTWHL